jgi:tetratricopeptide (TPR) repeat protein
MASLDTLLNDLEKETGTDGIEGTVQMTEELYQLAYTAETERDYDKAEDVCLKTLSLLKRSSFPPELKGRFHGLLGSLYNKSGRLGESLLNHNENADLMLEAGRIGEATAALGNCGAIMIYLRDRAGAYETQQKVIELALANNLSVELGRALINSSAILIERREFADAIENITRAKSIFEELEHPQGIAYSLAILAKVAEQQERYDDALAFINQATKIREEKCSDMEKILSYTAYGQILIAAGKPALAEEYCRKALKLATEGKLTRHRVHILLDLARSMVDRNLTTSANEIIEEVRTQMLDTDGNQDSSVYLLQLQSRIHYQENDLENAYKLLNSYIEEKEKLQSAQRDEEISRLKLAAEINTFLKEKQLIVAKDKEIQETNLKLRTAIDQVRTLRGILPICPGCKRIRDNDGYWQQIESYISSHSVAQFSHSLCHDCVEKLYPDIQLN